MCIKLILVPCMTTNTLTGRASFSLISRCTHTITTPYVTSFVNAVCRTVIGTCIPMPFRDAAYQKIPIRDTRPGDSQVYIAVSIKQTAI
jgi:hypothetical protein